MVYPIPPTIRLAGQLKQPPNGVLKRITRIQSNHPTFPHHISIPQKHVKISRELFGLRIVPPFHSHTIHVWYIYLHLVDFYGIHVGKYTIPMDPTGFASWFENLRNELVKVFRLHSWWV